jgi:hypothetical protein
MAGYSAASDLRAIDCERVGVFLSSGIADRNTGGSDAVRGRKKADRGGGASKRRPRPLDQATRTGGT